MAYIDLKNELPGIRGPMAYRPEMARPLNGLAEMLLRDDNSTLTRGEREFIGAYVSYLNDCFFCQHVHGALAGHYLQCNDLGAAGHSILCKPRAATGTGRLP